MSSTNTPEQWAEAIKLAREVVPPTVTRRRSQFLKSAEYDFHEVLDELWRGARMNYPPPETRCDEVGNPPKAPVRCRVRDCLLQEKPDWPTDSASLVASEDVFDVTGDTDLKTNKVLRERVQTYNGLGRYNTWVIDRLDELMSFGTGTVPDDVMLVLATANTIIGSSAGFDLVHGWIDDPDHGPAVNGGA